MSIRKEQCNKVCRILDDVLTNRPAERDSLIVAVRKAFEALELFGNSEQLPSAQPDPEWIPCSERLPIEPRHYLCSFNRPNRIDKIYVDLAYWTGDRWCGYRPDQINAWMPLPKPYKEKMNEKR